MSENLHDDVPATPKSTDDLTMYQLDLFAGGTDLDLNHASTGVSEHGPKGGQSLGIPAAVVKFEIP